MYGSIAELMANQPDFNRMKIRGGESPYREPVMPGEQRLIPSMQEKMQPALPPVQKAQTDANRFLDEYMGLGQDMGDTAQRITRSWIVRPVGSINYSDIRRELRKLGVRSHKANEYVYDMMDEYIGGSSWPPDPVE